jgi:muramoyltetrapeptide carboxypeptidase
LLHRIDWNRVAASGKAYVGFSDFTAFNMAAYACANLVTFHGPLLAVDFGNGDPSSFAQQHFWMALSRDSHRIDEFDCEHGYDARRIEGTLWGGNLSLLANLMGTPYFPAIDDGILYVEEISEEPYAVERLFLQLYHAGVLGRQRALLLGDFSDCKPTNPARYPYSMDEVVETLRQMLPFPVLTGLPFGHVARKVTLPFGAPRDAHHPRGLVLAALFRAPANALADHAAARIGMRFNPPSAGLRHCSSKCASRVFASARCRSFTGP